jgi:hypothetical protein
MMPTMPMALTALAFGACEAAVMCQGHSKAPQQRTTALFHCSKGPCFCSCCQQL